MTRKELQNNSNYSHVKTSRSRGYVSRVADIDNLKAAHYRGRYGEGFTVMIPSYDSTQYCFKEYYIRKPDSYMGGDSENATIEECMGNPAQEEYRDTMAELDDSYFSDNPFTDWLLNPVCKNESAGAMLARAYVKDDGAKSVVEMRKLLNFAENALRKKIVKIAHKKGLTKNELQDKCTEHGIDADNVEAILAIYDKMEVGA